MEENEVPEIQAEQEEQKELTVEDLETIAGGVESDAFAGAEVGEAGGDAGIKDLKSD